MIDFANLVNTKIMARFPKTSFLTALDVVDPREWLMARDRNSTFSTHLSLSIDNEEWKLTAEFLKRFTILETQFHALLPSNLIRNQFEDFLIERYDYVKDMSEMEFMRFIININPGSPYDDFMR